MSEDYNEQQEMEVKFPKGLSALVIKGASLDNEGFASPDFVTNLNNFLSQLNSQGISLVKIFETKTKTPAEAPYMGFNVQTELVAIVNNIPRD